MDSRFFAFDPRPTRIALFVGACVLAVLTAWAMAAARQTAEPLAEARAGVTAGLMLLFLYAFHRLRPRPDAARIKDRPRTADPVPDTACHVFKHCSRT